MNPRTLLQQLMDRDGLNTSSLAALLNNATKQSQIHRYLSGEAKEPRRSTLAPIAAHFRIPLDALYDPSVAEMTATQKQLDVLGMEKSKAAQGDTANPSPKLSQNAMALALMYDNLPNDGPLRIERMRAAINALLGLDR